MKGKKGKHACPICKDRFESAGLKLEHFVRRHVATNEASFVRCVCGRFFYDRCGVRASLQVRNHIEGCGGVDAHLLAARLGHGFLHSKKGYSLFAAHLAACEDLAAHLLAAVLGVGDA